MGLALTRRGSAWVVVALVVARAAVYAAFGAGLLVDDWTALGGRELHGVLETSSEDVLRSRPVGWLTFTVLYGLAGPHPNLLLVGVTALNLAAALLLLALLRRYLDPRVALAVVVLWIVVPNHTALTVWAANAQSGMALVLLFGGLLLLSRGAWFVAGLCLASSVLSYQLTLPLALVAPLVVGTSLLPLRATVAPPAEALDVRRRAGVLGLVLLAVAWAAAHPNYPVRWFNPPPGRIFSAHFGEGLFARAVPDAVEVVLGAAVIAGLVLAAVRLAQGERGRDGPLLAWVGVLVMGLGSLGVATAGSATFGMADRLYAISAIGAAMVLVGIVQTAASTPLRPALPVVVAALVVVALAGQVVALRSWSQAGRDAVALVAHVDGLDLPDDAAVVVGPAPVRRNGVVGLVSPVAPDNALWLRRGEAVGSLRIAVDPADFEVQEPGEVLVEWPPPEDRQDPARHS